MITFKSIWIGFVSVSFFAALAFMVVGAYKWYLGMEPATTEEFAYEGPIDHVLECIGSFLNSGIAREYTAPDCEVAGPSSSAAYCLSTKKITLGAITFSLIARTETGQVYTVTPVNFYDASQGFVATLVSK